MSGLSAAPTRRADWSQGAGAEAPGWAGRVMWMLRLGTQLVGVHVLGLLGTLAGGVLLGAAPALAQVGTLAAEVAHGRPVEHLWRTFWAGWRSDFRRANVIAVPFWAAAALLLLDSWVVQATAGTTRVVLVVGLVLVSGYVLIAACYLPLVVTRYRDTPGRSWRFLAVVPALFPFTGLGILVCAVAVAAVYIALPVLGALLGAALPLALAGRLTQAALSRTAR